MTNDDLTAAANKAGIDTPEKALLAFQIVNAFIGAGITDPTIAAAFATRAALQLQIIALQAKVQNLAVQRDAAIGDANKDIDAVRAAINDAAAKLQQTV